MHILISSCFLLIMGLPGIIRGFGGAGLANKDLYSTSVKGVICLHETENTLDIFASVCLCLCATKSQMVQMQCMQLSEHCHACRRPLEVAIEGHDQDNEGHDPDNEDSDSEEEGADMAEDEDVSPWVADIPRILGNEDEEFPPEALLLARGAEIDRCAVPQGSTTATSAQG